uniref:G-patch domain-containing protein n=1 Tax=Panagrellus redivivus TaxID=6233 RepID=A0A7E4ZU93_PANRE
MDSWGGNGGAAMSIADMITQAASEVMAENYLPGYVYVDAYQAYYNAETKMYYYPQNSMYYDTVKGCYLQYNRLACKYVPVVQAVQKPKTRWSKKRFRNKAISYFGRTELETFDQHNIDVFECVSDLVDRVSFLAGDDEETRLRHERKFGFGNVRADEDGLDDYVAHNRHRRRHYSDSSDPETDDEHDEYERRQREEQEASNPPCLRVIELHNHNRFHIITIDGALIGAGRQCDVQLPEEGSIDDEHLRIFYAVKQDADPSQGASSAAVAVSSDAKEKVYQVRNLSRHAILVNDSVLTRRRTTDINHGDVLLIGDNRVLVHIHKGMNTCNDCEPGILAKEAERAEAQSQQKKKSSESRRRDILNSMKRKYGLDKPASKYVDQDYTDRAKIRRKVVGSEIDVPKRPDTDDPYAKCAAAPIPGASLDTVQLRTAPKKEAAPLSEDNKGFKLLKGMGWKEGKGLGKAETGMTISIAENLKTAQRAGLGATSEAQEKAGPKTYKEKVLEKARERFDALGK